MAKNTSVTATDAAENRGLAKIRMSSRGWSLWRSQNPNETSRTTADSEGPDDDRVRPTPARAFDDAVEQQDQAARRQDGADEVECRCVLVPGVGHQGDDRDDRDDDQRDVDEEDRTPPVVLEQPAAGERPDRDTEA